MPGRATLALSRVVAPLPHWLAIGWPQPTIKTRRQMKIPLRPKWSKKSSIGCGSCLAYQAALLAQFVSGATMSNFVGLAQARQWIGQQQGVDVAEDGLWGIRPFPILVATPHSSSKKSPGHAGTRSSGHHPRTPPCPTGKQWM